MSCIQIVEISSLSKKNSLVLLKILSIDLVSYLNQIFQLNLTLPLTSSSIYSLWDQLKKVSISNLQRNYLEIECNSCPLENLSLIDSWRLVS